MQETARQRQVEIVATICFVLSGASALAYEVLWFKRFSHVWGSSSLAMASVVASFLAGLGLGAWWFGRRADRMARPLSAYAYCEFGIAAWALCVPWITPWCARMASAATPALAEQPLLLSAVRVGITFLTLAPACMLMGATLPLLVRWLASHGRSTGLSSAWLYAANAAGASAGAWLAGFHLLPNLGLDGTNLAALALSAGVGLLALVTDRRTESSPVPEAPGAGQSSASLAASAPGGPTAEPAPRWAIHGAALLTGFGSLALQMTWGRELALLVGATTHAFSALVVVFIAGLGAGSLCYALARRRFGDPRNAVALCVLLVCLGTLAGRWLEPALARLAGSFVEARASAWFNSFLCLSTSAALVGIATFAMGLCFPALIALCESGGTSVGTSRGDGPRGADAGASVGRVYGWNTLGSIAGALLTSTLLLPAVGGEGVVVLALCCYVLALLCVLAPRWKGREAHLTSALACVGLLFLPWRAEDPRGTNLGLYLYGANVEAALSGDRSRVLSFTEGSSANVLALEFDADASTPGAPPRVKNLRVNGKVDASNWEDMPMQLGAAYFPMMLRPKARRVLVIGMGSGTTAGATLLFPETLVTCCELEPAILEASRSFAPENKNPHASPRFRPVVDDGRNFVQSFSRGADSRFDLIVSEPSNPWIAGISNLYTREFYAAARGRLAPNGMLVQWLQTYGLSASQYALVARTVLEAFPSVTLLRINDYDTLLLCSEAPIVPPVSQLDDAQTAIDAMPDVQQDLLRYFGSSDVRALLLSVLMLDDQGLRTLCSNVGDGSVNTDGNLKLEFGAPRDLYALKASGAGRPMDAIHAAFDPRFTARLITTWGWGEPQAQALRGHKRAFTALGDRARAFAMNELLLAWQPEDLQAQGDQLLWSPPTDLGELTEAVAALVSRSPLDAARVGKGWLDQSQFARAKLVFRALQASMPDSPTVLSSLALCLANLAEPDEARMLLERARKVDPLDPLLLDLERVLHSR